MRNIETFPSKQMCPYLSLDERKVAEFYHNIDRRRWLVWLKWLNFTNFSGQLMVSLFLVIWKFIHFRSFSVFFTTRESTKFTICASGAWPRIRTLSPHIWPYRRGSMRKRFSSTLERNVLMRFFPGTSRSHAKNQRLLRLLWNDSAGMKTIFWGTVFFRNIQKKAAANFWIGFSFIIEQNLKLQLSLSQFNFQVETFVDEMQGCDSCKTPNK